MICEENGKHILYSKDGKQKLGEFDTEVEAKDREAEIQRIKNAKAEVDLIITKANIGPDGQPRWAVTASDTGTDRVGDQTTIGLFEDWIARIEQSQAVDWLPAPRKPFLGIAHYPDLDGYGEAGGTDKAYIDGQQFKAAGVFFTDQTHPFGPKLYNAVSEEQALIKRGGIVEKPIRISAAWWDIQHAHGDFIFTRRSLDDVCPMCAKGVGDKTYLKGQLDHFAATRVPINPRTRLTLEEKSMATRKTDAESIIGTEGAEELEKKTRQLVGKSEAGGALVIRGMGGYLKKMRKKAGMSLEDVAKAMDEDVETVKAYEDEDKKPGEKMMKVMAKAYKMADEDIEEMKAMLDKEGDDKKPMKAESKDDKDIPPFLKKKKGKKTDGEEDEEEEEGKEKKSGAVIDLSTLNPSVRDQVLKALSGGVVEKMGYDESMMPMMEYKPLAGATSFEEAEAYIESQELMGQMMTNWDLLKGVMSNILGMEPEEGEMDSDLNRRKVEAMKTAMAEFGDKVAALKAGLADAYLIHPVVTQPDSGQETIELPQIERSQTMSTQENDAILAQADIQAIVQNSKLSREEKQAALQEILNNTAVALRSELDRANPPDVSKLVSEQIQQSLVPITEQLGIIAARLNQPGQAQQAQPVQRSISQLPATATTGPIPGKPSSIKAAVAKSLGMPTQ